MSSLTYWRKREAEAQKTYIKEERAYDKRIQKIYMDMLDACQKEIEAFYGKYATAEKISIAEAKKRVSKMDIAAYERKAKKYVEDASKDRRINGGRTNFKGYYFSEKANAEMRLYNATMKINRLEMLKANIGLEMVKGHAELETFLESVLDKRTYDEIERMAGILGESIVQNARAAHAIVNASFHNATFSERLWNYHDTMKADMDKLLQTGLIQGKNGRVLAREMRQYYIGPEKLKNGKNGAIFNTERLMRTELTRVQTEAQKQSFVRNGFKQYTFIANSGCCDACSEINGKHFNVKDMMPGENAPPMHPFCRCGIAAYEDSDEYEAWLDYLESGGTTADWNEFAKKEWEKAKKSLANSVIRNTIKSLDIDDFKVLAHGKGIQQDVLDTITKTIKEFEESGDMYIAGTHFGEFYDKKTGKPALFQVFQDANGLTQLNINTKMLAGRSVEEINEIIAGTETNLPTNIREALIHECGHAKAYYGKSAAEVDAMNTALEQKHIAGVSPYAMTDGAECIAEVEVLLHRGEEVPEEAMVLYNEYVKGKAK